MLYIRALAAAVLRELPAGGTERIANRDVQILMCAVGESAGILREAHQARLDLGVHARR